MQQFLHIVRSVLKLPLSNFMLRAVHFLFLSSQNTELFTSFQIRTAQNLDSGLNFKFINFKKKFISLFEFIKKVYFLFHPNT